MGGEGPVPLPPPLDPRMHIHWSILFCVFIIIFYCSRFILFATHHLTFTNSEDPDEMPHNAWYLSELIPDNCLPLHFVMVKKDL